MFLKEMSMRSQINWVTCAILISVCVGVSGRSVAAAEQDIPDEIVKKVDPSVVAIKHETAVGSGFVISEDGFILSNGHVVRGSDDEDPTEAAKSITVILNDDRKFSARVLGFCMNPDVALLKIECDTPLKPVEYADSINAHIGQNVFAVGTPHGLKRTFSSGILSNVDRMDLGTFTKVFQTDAAINPGNSGGPLFDLKGRVLGINTYASSGANNLGFTIPIHVVEEVRKDIMKDGRFVRSDVPVFFVKELYEEMRKALGVDRGVLVDFVMEGTKAYGAGLRTGDVIVKQNGKDVSAGTEVELNDFMWALTILEPGTSVNWTVLRKDSGSIKDVEVTTKVEEAELMPSTKQFPGEIKTEKYDALGLSFKEIVRDHRIMYRLQDDPGVLVAGTEKGSPAESADLRSNDIITSVDGVSVTNAASFRMQLESRLSQQEKYIDLTVRRRQLITRTVLAPYYDLKDLNVVVLVPSGGPRYLGLVLRELIAQGATLTLASLDGTVDSADAAGREVAKVSDIKGGDVDLLLLLDGGNAREYWENESVLELIRAAYKNEGSTLAAIGSSAITLIAAQPELLEKKMTTCKDDSSEAIQREAQYTGNAVEKDNGFVTTTGFDRKTIRAFLKELSRISSSSVSSSTGSEGSEEESDKGDAE